MGISPSTARHLVETTQRFRISGTMLSLGRQDIHLSISQLLEILLQYGLAQRPDPQGPVILPPLAMETVQALMRDDRHLSPIPDHRAKGLISDKMFFAALGFSRCDSIDANSFDHADYIFDLNASGLRQQLNADYDFVLDCGTIEHVFDTRAVLRNMFEATRVGGHIMHLTPSNNLVDHGFYQISPTLFVDYYGANDFSIRATKFFRYTANADTEPWFYADYIPGSLDGISLGDGAFYGVSICAQKTEKSSWERIPTQGYYKAIWK